MNAFGESALWAASVIMILGSLVPLLLVKKQSSFAFQFIRLCAVSNFILMTIAFLSLVIAFLVSDFTLQIVVSHSHSKTPLLYRFSGVWGNHEGSMLLWIWILSLYTLLVSLGSKIKKISCLKILSVQFFLSLGFLVYILLLANPFMLALDKVKEGLDLNPILQDPALAIHPPLLYLGYVGFSVAYSFSIVGLFEERINPEWAQQVKKWVLISWIFLTLGIATGSFWAYYELGWGGYWFWDPVENAALMPWILGTALIHSLIGLEKRDLFRRWNPFLGIATFTLCLIGTYIVRSGVISSIHSFAMDPTRGAYILGFTFLVIIFGIGAFIWYRPKALSYDSFHFFSREGGIVVNNILLTLMSILVLIGTLFPLFSGFFFDRTLTVGTEYFYATIIPLSFVAIMVMIGGGRFSWGKATQKQRMRWFNFLMAGSIGILYSFYNDSVQKSFGLTGLILALLALLSSFLESRESSKKRRNYAMMCSHAGFALAIMGMSLLNLGSSKTSIILTVGEIATYKDYILQLKEMKTFKKDTYEVRQALLEVKCGKEKSQIMIPEKRFYEASQTLTTEIALKHSWFTDLYIVLGGVLPNEKWIFEIAVYPGIQLLWIGAFFIALGGIFGLIKFRKNPVRIIFLKKNSL